MRILIVGASGTVGQAVTSALSSQHEIVKAGRSHGEFRVDILDIGKVRSLFKEVGTIDAVVCTAGNVHFGPLATMSAEKLWIGLQDKLMGQINLVLAGQTYLTDGGSFTLTTGSLSQIPIREASSASMVDGALESFVRAAAIELPRGLRINAVSPTILQESMDAFGHYFHGYEPVPASRVALAYVRSIEGAQTGEVYKVW
jgi:NAD(P)-dependent dehydrogenase (short-subunit alcohol dehydrogenase family)